MNNQEFVVVPVMRKFDSGDVIGELRIRADALPPTPNFVFSLGYQALEFSGVPGEIPTEAYVGKYKLIGVSLTRDDDYLGYLRQIGKV